MFGRRRKRTREEQKEYENRVYESFRDRTIVMTERVFRFTRLDKGIRNLQVFTESHRKGTVIVIGGMMAFILLYFAVNGKNAGGDSDLYATLRLTGSVVRIPSGYGDVFRSSQPKAFVERVIRELDIDTLRYRTDSVYRIEINRRFIVLYGRFELPVGKGDSTEVKLNK